MFARRHQFSMRSQTTDHLLQKLADDSRPHSLIYYDQQTLCQRHRQQHLNHCQHPQQQQQQQHEQPLCLPPVDAFPLLLQPREHLVARSPEDGSGDILMLRRLAMHAPCSAPVSISAAAAANPIASSMTSFSLECAGDAYVDDVRGVTEDTLSTVM